MNKSILLDALGGLFNGVVHENNNFGLKTISFKDLESQFFYQIPNNLKIYDNNHFCNKDMKIIVKDTMNNNYNINCCENCKIGNIKLELINYSIDRPMYWKLYFSMKNMEDDNSLNFYGIKNYSILYLRGDIDMRGSGPSEFYLPDELCDPKYDYDFRNIKDNGKKFFRGGHEYKRPYGWRRYALNVKGKYGDDAWL